MGGHEASGAGGEAAEGVVVCGVLAAAEPAELVGAAGAGDVVAAALFEDRGGALGAFLGAVDVLRG